jgi:hypothetical protein
MRSTIPITAAFAGIHEPILRHQHQQRNLPDIRRFTRHIPGR